MKNTTITLLLLLLLSSCNSKSEQHNLIDVEMSHSVESFCDSLFMVRVSMMSELNGNLIVYDYELGKFIIFNQELEYLNMFGAKGSARSEFRDVSSFLTKDDGTIIIGDPWHKSYKFFDSDGNYMSSIEYNNNCYRSKKIALSDGYIIDGSQNNIFMELDIQDSNNIKQYGEKEKYSSESQTRFRNTYSFYLNDDGYLFALSESAPFINIYSDKRELVEQFYYDDIDFVSQQQKRSEAEFNVDNSYFCLVGDSYMVDNYLYILIATNHDGYNVSKVVVLDTSKNKCKIEKCISLEGSIYNCLCVIDSKLYAFNYKTAAIEMYKL